MPTFNLKSAIFDIIGARMMQRPFFHASTSSSQIIIIIDARKHRILINVCHIALAGLRQSHSEGVHCTVFCMFYCRRFRYYILAYCYLFWTFLCVGLHYILLVSLRNVTVIQLSRYLYIHTKICLLQSTYLSNIHVYIHIHTAVSTFVIHVVLC
jgi:hypothetical protein